jgi:hypothetical protein
VYAERRKVFVVRVVKPEFLEHFLGVCIAGVVARGQTLCANANAITALAASIANPRPQYFGRK